MDNASSFKCTALMALASFTPARIKLDRTSQEENLTTIIKGSDNKIMSFVRFEHFCVLLYLGVKLQEIK